MPEADHDLLHNMKVARPCKMAWDEMPGEGNVRHCEQCRADVFQLDKLSPDQTEALISSCNAGDKRLYRRADGTVKLVNCPERLPGWREYAAILAFVALLVAVVFGLTKAELDKAISESMSGFVVPQRQPLNKYSDQTETGTAVN